VPDVESVNGVPVAIVTTDVNTAGEATEMLTVVVVYPIAASQ
jgi:hypothetical protein